jgi:hypothetical protein
MKKYLFQLLVELFKFGKQDGISGNINEHREMEDIRLVEANNEGNNDRIFEEPRLKSLNLG